MADAGFCLKKKLEAFLNQVPPVPMSVAETGISSSELLNLLMKIILVRALETASSFAEAIHLPRKIVSELLEQAVASQLLLVLGSLGPSGLDDMRYGLSEKGRRWAGEALPMFAYTGPAPVSLDGYTQRILLQEVTNETITWPRIH